MKLFAVRDVKADSFGAPLSIATRGLAVRSFQDACLRKDSDLSKYPQDYMLFELGEYDPNSGRLSSNSVPVFIASAVEVIAAERATRAVSEPELPGVVPEVN